MGKMNETQKMKRNFRNSKVWRLFRKSKMNEQKNICFISHRKLSGRWQLHHRLHSTKYAEEHYKDLSDPNNFIAVNSKQHDLLHDLIYGYVKYGGEEYLQRLMDEVRYEVQLNNLYMSNIKEGTDNV